MANLTSVRKSKLKKISLAAASVLLCGALFGTIALSGCSSDDDVVVDTPTADTGSADTGSGNTGSGDTGSSDTGSGDTGSGDTSSEDTSATSDRWGDGTMDASAEVNQQLAEESIVLLKNTNNALPISTSATNKTMVSVFGRDASDMYYAGGGSGTGADAWTNYKQGYDYISIYDSLEAANFEVNETVKNVYDAYEETATDTYDNSAGAPNEMPASNLSSGLVSSAAKAGIALIVFGRTGSEGADLNTGSYSMDENGNLTENSPHMLKLSTEEKNLVSYVTQQGFSKVVVVLNIPMAFECGDLQDNTSIDGILWMGHPGVNGTIAVGEALSGSINPSGRLADIYARDFTQDPTFYNVGENTQITDSEGKTGTYSYFYNTEELTEAEEAQLKVADAGEGDSDSDSDSGDGTETTGYSGTWYGIEYEESIYYGYRYYETRGYEESKNATTASTDSSATDWYGKNVVYPFGYGLSYTSFTWSDMTVKTIGEDKDGYSDVYYEVSVKVTNTGKVAGKDVVELYYSAPYTEGGIEKSYVELADFEKTDTLWPGQSQIVTLTVYKQDMASFDYNDANSNNNIGYELECGDYELRLQTNSHDVKVDGEDELTYTVTIGDSGVSNAYLATASTDSTKAICYTKDRVTGATVSALFSETDNTAAAYQYNSLGVYTTGTSGSSDTFGANGDMTLMSRANFAETFPTTPIYDTEQSSTTQGITGTTTVTTYGIDLGVERSNAMVNAKLLSTKGITTNTTSETVDESNTVWGSYYKGIIDKYISTGTDGTAVWTQADDESGTVTITYSDLIGKDFDDPLWDEFMNQMTWDELVGYINVLMYQSAPIERLGVWSTMHADGPVCMHHQFVSDAHGWQYVATTNVAATWNKDLAKAEGNAIGNEAEAMDEQGWYAPGLNLHRSPFGGRNFEYYAEDGVLAGKIASQVVLGVQSHGVNCYIKHFAVNQQESNRSGLLTYLTEQDLRQNYLKAFQLCVEEGGAMGCMVSMNCIGNISTYNNFQLANAVLRQEWGFNGVITTDIIDTPTEGEMDVDLTLFRRACIVNTLTFSTSLSGSCTWDSTNGCVVDEDGNRNDYEWASIRMAVKYGLYANVNTNEMNDPTFDAYDMEWLMNWMLGLG